MSWVDDFASGMGIPAGATTLAVAMYAACVAAERAARPEALKEIGRILKDPSWSRSLRPSTIIERMFKWTFGERHLTVRTAFSSAVATVVMLSLVLLMAASHRSKLISFFFADGIFGHRNIRVQTLIDLALIGFLADYLSLGKARWFMRRISYPGNVAIVSLLTLGDLVCSMVISTMMSGMAFFLNTVWLGGKLGFWMATEPLLEWLDIGGAILGRDIDHLGDMTLLAPSTLLTSIWALLILVPTAILKLLAPLQRFTVWFFNVEKRPLQAIGIVSSALVMIASLIWSLIRAII
jgi:hypothetical protein